MSKSINRVDKNGVLIHVEDLIVVPLGDGALLAEVKHDPSRHEPYYVTDMDDFQEAFTLVPNWEECEVINVNS